MDAPFPFLAADAHSRLAYVELPDDIPLDLLALELPRSLPLPVLLNSCQRDAEQVEFNWDHVLQGVLCLLTQQPQHPQASLYRTLALAIQPQLSHHLLQASRQLRDQLDWQPAQQLLYLLMAFHAAEIWPLLELGFLYEQALRSCQQREDQAGHQQWLRLANTLYQRIGEHRQLDAKSCYQMLCYYLNQQQYPQLYQLVSQHALLLAEATEEGAPSLGEADLVQLREQLAPFQPGLPAQRALQHYFDGDYSQAHLLLQQHDDRSVFVRQLQAIQLYHLQDYPRAKGLFEALARKSSYPHIAPYLGLCCESMGLWQQAGQHWQRLLEQDSDNVQAMHHLALVAQRQGRPKEAQSFWQSLACFDPSFPALRHRLQDSL